MPRGPWKLVQPSTHPAFSTTVWIRLPSGQPIKAQMTTSGAFSPIDPFWQSVDDANFMIPWWFPTAWRPV